MLQVEQPLLPLTPQDWQVLECLANGTTTNLGIADVLCVSPHTVHWRMQNLYVKLGCCDRAQLVAWYFRSGLSVVAAA